MPLRLSPDQLLIAAKLLTRVIETGDVEVTHCEIDKAGVTGLPTIEVKIYVPASLPFTYYIDEEGHQY